MGQITSATIKMIRDYAARGEHPPLTVHEIAQLATAWERGQPAASAEPWKPLWDDIMAVAESGGTPTSARMRDWAWQLRRIAAPVAQTEPLHITHGPLMREAATLLRLRRPVTPGLERVAAELEQAADGHPAPAGEPSPEWMQVAEIAAQVQPQQAENQEALADTQRAIIEAAERRGYARAEAENVGYRTDAGRYRFIRPGDKDVWCSSGDDLLSGVQLDAAIDAARAAKEDHHG